MSQAQNPAAPAEAAMGQEVERLVASARDALTDDMVVRLSATLGEGLDLLDRVNRSGVADALPTISEMVRNGDLQRLANLARFAGSVEDSLSDDIVGRMAETATAGLDLLDRVNRSGIARALPAITQLVENGDLDRLVGLARLIASIEDSLSDDIVHRLALVVTGMAALVDKLARNDGFLHLIDLMGRDDVQRNISDFAEAACAAREQAEKAPPGRGGIAGLWQIAKDPATQDALRFLALIKGNLKTRPTRAP
jgi:uncharacterized protein YjgD (DUF1641 family)